MKRIICLIIAAVMIFCLGSCGDDKNKTVSISTEDGKSEEVSYPVGNPDNYTESDCDTGMRFTLTLHNYTDNFNAVYNELGGNGEKFSYTKWKKTKKDDEKYEYFYLKSGNIVLTATVEKESLCLVNVGCGVSADIYGKNKKNRERVLRVSAICAIASGGYTADDLDFFSALFEKTEEDEEHSFWFNNSIYIYSESERDKTVLFRVMPATEGKRDEWHISDFIMNAS